jgi:molybdate/tungstate transport system substrate-binding protein
MTRFRLIAGNIAMIAVTTLLMLFPNPVISAEQEIAGDLVIFHAGSLSIPFKEISASFMEKYPKVKVLREASGSRTAARKISELNRPADIMASADYTVIDTLLIPEYASWNIKLATNEMVIGYLESSRMADVITSDNWYEILLNSNVAFGRSDPNADPCGYRSVLTMKLAEKFYKKDGLAGELLKKDHKYIRPKETDLIALLEAGEMDYFFIYRSVAEQHKMKYVILPDEINLKNPAFSDFYQTASVEISGKKPGTTVVKKGAPMMYGVTIPKCSPNPEAAMAFISFLLDKDGGMAIMEKNGQPSAVPSATNSFDNLPENLKKFAKPE